jgi:hypothetical protein
VFRETCWPNQTFPLRPSAPPTPIPPPHYKQKNQTKFHDNITRRSEERKEKYTTNKRTNEHDDILDQQNLFFGPDQGSNQSLLARVHRITKKTDESAQNMG